MNMFRIRPSVFPHRRGLLQQVLFGHSGLRIGKDGLDVTPEKATLIPAGNTMRSNILRAVFAVLTLSFVLQDRLPAQGSSHHGLWVRVMPMLDSLLADEDTDGDKRITIDDPHIAGTFRGDKRFWLRATDARAFEVSGTYHLANLLAFLKTAQDERRDTVQLSVADVFSPPFNHIADAIKSSYWNGLTRRIDAAGLPGVFRDEKTTTTNGRHYVYVPPSDTMAFGYFSRIASEHPSLEMNVVRIPESVTPAFLKGLDGKEGVLSLGLRRGEDGSVEGLPFVVPGGRFNEMYGWDSYFMTLGLLQDGKIDLARSMVDNFVYEIQNYGKILNANRTYYLTRSQPPFLTSMVLAVYDRLPKSQANRQWLARGLDAAIREYRQVWMASDHMTPIGLSRYFDTGSGPPPEVEPGRYDKEFEQYAKARGETVEHLEKEYTNGTVRIPELDKFFKDDRSMRESGHDASYRLLNDCAELATVDLNSLLYKAESDLATAITTVFGGRLTLADGTVVTAKRWELAARKRKALMAKYLWNEKKGLFFDYNVVEGRQTDFVSATTLYPLWAGLVDRAQARRLVRTAIPLLAMPGGIVGSTEHSRGPITQDHPQTQWDYPFGWAPHQMLVWSGLRRYGYAGLARDLAYRWLYTVTVNACNYNGTIAEKYDVVIRSSQVFAEYGNVGTTFSYLTREGFGWTNASYVVGRTFLHDEDVARLNRLIPPEWIFPDLSSELPPNP